MPELQELELFAAVLLLGGHDLLKDSPSLILRFNEVSSHVLFLADVSKHLHERVLNAI